MNNLYMKRKFVRWIKDNNLLGLIKYLMVKYPSNDYPKERWINYLKGEESKFFRIIISLPFEWNDETQPRKFNIMTKNGNDTWEEIDREWRTYYNEIRFLDGK